MSNIIIPELLYYAENYVINSFVNKTKIPQPPTISSVYLSDNSFIRLLFDEDWPQEFDSYKYLFTAESLASVPETIRRRMMVYPSTSKYFIISDDGLNVFNLQEDDFHMLDLLLEYRIDSTCVIDVEFEDLSTNLSKLIYSYLKFKQEENIYHIDTIETISDDFQILENFYEAFILDIVFEYLSDLGLEGD